jgi:biopolymer transport protein TolR
MAFSTNGPKGLSSEINVTPLIDVLLVLLIIFMVIVPLAPLGMDTTIPSPGNPQSPIQPAETPVLVQLEAQLNGDPTYRIDGVSIAREAIDARLHDLMASRAQRQMLVQADARLDFGLVSSVVDAGHAAGADTVGLITPLVQASQ